MKVSNGIFFMNASLLGVLGLGACATVGENDFACPGRPSGVRCASALEVYRATEGTDVIAATAGERFPRERTKENEWRVARATVTLGAGESGDVTLPCDFEPKKLVVDPDVRVLILERSKAEAPLRAAAGGGA